MNVTPASVAANAARKLILEAEFADATHGTPMPCYTIRSTRGSRRFRAEETTVDMARGRVSPGPAVTFGFGAPQVVRSDPDFAGILRHILMSVRGVTERGRDSARRIQRHAELKLEEIKRSTGARSRATGGVGRGRS